LNLFPFHYDTSSPPRLLGCGVTVLSDTLLSLNSVVGDFLSFCFLLFGCRFSFWLLKRGRISFCSFTVPVLSPTVPSHSFYPGLVRVKRAVPLLPLTFFFPIRLLPTPNFILFRRSFPPARKLRRLSSSSIVYSSTEPIYPTPEPPSEPCSSLHHKQTFHLFGPSNPPHVILHYSSLFLLILHPSRKLGSERYRGAPHGTVFPSPVRVIFLLNIIGKLRWSHFFCGRPFR